MVPIPTTGRTLTDAVKKLNPGSRQGSGREFIFTDSW